MVYSVCLENNLPLVITMGGGYSRPMTGEHLKHQLKHMGMSIGQQLCAMVP
jgi:hypothetical protein